MHKLRICFAGTPAFAAAHLAELLKSEHTVVAVYTQPDRPAGRGKKLQASTVKQLALQHKIPLQQPGSLKDTEQIQILVNYEPDVLVVVAYGLILPRQILDVPRFGCVNVHASLLPRWRGAAPIERALLAGDEVTGVTIMRMDAGLDTGDILSTEIVTIEDTDTGPDLEDKLSVAGRKALIRVLDDLQNALENSVKQDDSASTYAAKLDKSDSEIRWDRPAVSINRQIRACAGRSPAFSFLDGERLRILSATPFPSSKNGRHGTIVEVSKSRIRIQCSESELEIGRIQLPGKNAMAVTELFNSRPDFFKVGSVFASGEAAD